MGAQVEFYRDVLGLEIGYPRTQTDYTNEHWITFETGACVLALHGGSSKNQGPDAAKFVFGSTDIDRAQRCLKRHGVKVSEIREPAPGVRVFDGWDPEGNVFSIEAKT